MKKTLVKRSFPIVLAALLTLVIGFVAGTAYGQQSVRLVINGRDVAADVPPFIMDGRTFVPIRFVAEALNLPVKFDPQANAVYIGIPPEGVDLVTDLPPFKFKSDAEVITNLKVSGITYNRGFEIGSGAIYWNLGNRYRTLTFSAGCPDSWRYGSELTIYGDDKKLGVVKQPYPSDGLKTFTFDVSGVNILIIEGQGGYITAIINPRVQ